MSQINTNVSALLAQTALSQQNKALSTSLERLSTGLQINSGADNPAGLIASQNLQAQQAGISAALGNSQRADQVMSIADGGLSEINNMLLQLQSLVGQSANTSGMVVQLADPSASAASLNPGVSTTGPPCAPVGPSVPDMK